MKRFVLSQILLFLAATPCLAVEPGQTSTIADPQGIAAFVQRLDELRLEANIPGVSVAVLEDQSILLATGLGYADLEKQIPATADTPYDIASVAKPLSAVVAMKLAESGVLDLDTPIAQYSEWAGFCANFSEQPSIFARDLECEPPVHTLRQLLSHTAAWTPGTRFSYNPVLYSWASRPMMAATDTPFSTLVDQHVFEPVGMKDSARKHRDLPLRADLAQRLATPYRLDDEGEILPAGPGSPQGDGAAGGVVATVLDLAKFDVAFDEDVLVSAESREAMMTPTKSTGGESLPYGLGWYVQQYNGLKLVWHSGWWPDAYSALYLKIPSLDLSFILLANSEGVWWDNPLDRAEVDRSPFVQAFLSAFVDR